MRLFAGILVVLVMTCAVQADTVVQVNLNGYVNGIFGDQISSYQIQLFDEETPTTVANFLKYVNNNAYNNTIIHRNEIGDAQNPQIIQGGGFKLQVTNNVVTALNPIATYGTIQNESQLSNVRGTIAMARTGDPNSATSQWYVNVADNVYLDKSQTNDGYAVFGQVAGEGMTLIDAVNQIPTYNINSLYDPNGTLGHPFSKVPLPGGSIFVTVLSTNVISTVAWKGGASSAPTDWGTLANWGSGTSVPNAAGVNLSIGSQASANNVIDLGSANRTVGNIYFTPFTSTTIRSTGGKSLTLDNNGKTATVNGLGNQTISASMIFNSNTVFSVNGTLTVSGAISGAGKLGVTGTGTLLLSGANTYAGNTLVNSGTLTALNTASLPGYNTSGKITVDEGGILAVRVGAATGEWAASDIDTLRNNVGFNAGSMLGFDTTSGPYSYGSVIGGTLGVAKAGANTLMLTGANTFTGPVSFNGGTLKVASLNSLGNGAALNFNGGSLQFDAVFDPSVRTITFQTGRGILDTQDKSIVLAHSIGNGGAGGLTKQGSGMLTLSASPNYKGATIINNGTLQLGVPGSGVTLPANTAVNLNSATAKLDFNGNSQSIAMMSGVAGSEVKLGGGALTTGNYTYTFDGNITSTSGGSLTKTGTGDLTLTGVNTYAGNTQVNQGNLVALKAASLPGYNVLGKVTVNSNGALIVKAGAPRASGSSRKSTPCKVKRFSSAALSWPSTPATAISPMAALW